MKASVLCSATLFSLATFAFPASMLKGDISRTTLVEITALTERISRDLESKRSGAHVKRAFNAEAQRISTSGDHRYIAPGPNDLRGPCPGINVMANHGYLPRNGISTITQMTTAANEVFGMGLDLSAFLAVYSAVMAGDLTSFSIGGKPKTGGLLGGAISSLGLLREPQGLSASHNRFEVDGSPTRSDLYSNGDPVSLNLDFFEQLLSMPLGKNGIDIPVLTAFRLDRTRHSIATNGHYFSGPLQTLALNPATYQFTYRFFANHTAENPEGYLDAKTLMSFQGVTGEKGNYKWARGQEKIPENWYRRVIGDDYSILSFAAEAVSLEVAHPELIRIGGNTGQPNSFTGNVFNAQTLLEGNNLMCLAFQAASEGAPDILRGLFGNILIAVQKLASVLDPIIAELGCPELVKYDKSLFKAFPGAGSAV
ncbi:hypothetical protein COCCADRAFT_6478 [Bipolaris zeicola 26-R-13]|uniref:Heme haloperoxidase family profile domain-containing protein n=1 Tax=Cochliobolus carbonum (strain 26-R-13) TaxID=930089 RepID=W6Y1X7_COCC2|nr:uncharacterized protein COCCADRAFT_6478 [Bipolaris zeicola 26-R-13]EUC31640.1 hypothetical protein COCCADRAFT_6478 [Bipolaris zeicola 26-R-13]